ncbi:ABC transporter ATP-binding protein [Lichenihabitans sp. PAMC28606]|uniref:ABC transporter ATP-binding protein n=1 Tax=Lichenihabitans sp. PAMC28606 TaxID=2880932 RepID=UPI001D0B08B5|nr:ABC transporter ATP-binding protein [Lichenihabitans sp. PAMC28606]UDL96004.1 ABC transporter ATP-binding protein [Lichenihabitans sp. PAMC28606]
MSEAVLLEVTALAKRYGGVQAVRGVSFRLMRGEILALIGPNGAGKSTCFNMLNGQIKPDGGTILLDGQAVTGLSPAGMWRRGVGRTFQITATFGSMTVRENVQTALLAHAGRIRRMIGTAGNAQREEADSLLDLVGLRQQGERVCRALAYGDLKRLELAVALTNDPKLLLMDEPTAGMAPSERIALMRFTADLARRRSIGVLFTEHDMDIVFEHADRVMVLNRGELIAVGTPDVVRRDERVRATYLGDGLVYAPQGGQEATT